jgi:hypothetical protein
MANRTARVSIRLTKQEKDKLVMEAEAHNIPLAQMIRRAVRAYLKAVDNMEVSRVSAQRAAGNPQCRDREQS